MANHLTLAVAGSGKTRGIVEHCAVQPVERQVLVLTFTRANQEELRSRLATRAGNRTNIEVLGWYTFLIRHFARPFVPFKFHGYRIRGLNFEGRPSRFAKNVNRFLDSNSMVYACELGRLAFELIGASNGSLLKRLECIYDEILIDEVQDLSSYDLEIADALFESSIDVRMVGDIRQAVLSTNPRSKKNKQFAFAESINWFMERVNKKVLEKSESSVTWRCRQEIASYADLIFKTSGLFPVTQSRNATVTEHDGVFLVHSKHIIEYVDQYAPLCLRASANSGKAYDLNYINFNVSKGTEVERVLIVPTAKIVEFIQKGTALSAKPAASYYVAVTRAKQSVAIVVDDKGKSTLPVWEPACE